MTQTATPVVLDDLFEKKLYVFNTIARRRPGIEEHRLLDIVYCMQELGIVDLEYDIGIKVLFPECQKLFYDLRYLASNDLLLMRKEEGSGAWLIWPKRTTSYKNNAVEGFVEELSALSDVGLTLLAAILNAAKSYGNDPYRIIRELTEGRSFMDVRLVKEVVLWATSKGYLAKIKK